MKFSPHEVTRDSLVADMRRAYVLGACGLLVIGLTIIGLGSVDRSMLRSIYESREVTRLGRQARLLAVDRETAIRGYLITGDPKSLDPEHTASKALPPTVDSLMALVGPSATRQDQVENVRKSLGRWDRGYRQPALAAAQTSGNHDLAGKELFDSVRSAFASFLSSEELLYQRRIAQERIVVTASLAIFLLEIMFVVLMMRRLSGRVVTQAEQVLEQQEQLEEQAVELEHQAAELEMQAVQLGEQHDDSRETAEALAKTNEELKATVSELEKARDDTRRRAMELEKTQLLLDFVLHSSPVGFGLFDESLRVTLANEALASMADMSPQQAVGQTPRDVLSSELAEQIEKLAATVLESGQPVLNVPVAGSMKAQSAVERFWTVSFFPVAMGIGGSRAGIGGMITEVSDRRRLEAQLLEAQKMEAVGRLAGGIAHDFNNYLTAIKSYSDLLLVDMDESNPQKFDVREINSAADRAAALTRQLLAFSRQQMLRPVVMDLNATVDGMRAMLRPLAGSAIRVETRLQSTGKVTADPAQIERVILNLVMNARDAMPDGGSLVIETANVELDEQAARDHSGVQPGPYVMLAVSDTGTGMTKEIKDKLFEPFFTTKSRSKGTGLGLSSVYGIVRQSGGNVWVYSEPGQGSTFKIYLPLETSKQERAPGANARAKLSGGAVVMLVEDDDGVRRVACRILKRAGFAVLEAESGASALEVYEAADCNVDLVLTDVVMPEMNGSELAEKIRQLNPTAKILFMSGFTEDKVVRDKLLSPGAAFLEKPFTPESLMRKTREVLATPVRGAAA